MSTRSFTVQVARPEQYPAIGKMLVEVYASLPGMPSPAEQPDYYAMLLDVGKRASNPAFTIFVAVREPDGELLGSVDFIDDMTQYGSGGTASSVPDAAGVRLLGVKSSARGMGVGKALTEHCIGEARAKGKSRVVLHTTRTMQTAWGMYERIGFRRFPAIDFLQGRLEVFGFSLPVQPSQST